MEALKKYYYLIQDDLKKVDLLNMLEIIKLILQEKLTEEEREEIGIFHNFLVTSIKELIFKKVNDKIKDLISEIREIQDKYYKGAKVKHKTISDEDEKKIEKIEDMIKIEDEILTELKYKMHKTSKLSYEEGYKSYLRKIKAKANKEMKNIKNIKKYLKKNKVPRKKREKKEKIIVPVIAPVIVPVSKKINKYREELIKELILDLTNIKNKIKQKYDKNEYMIDLINKEL